MDILGHGRSRVNHSNYLKLGNFLYYEYQNTEIDAGALPEQNIQTRTNLGTFIYQIGPTWNQIRDLQI